MHIINSARLIYLSSNAHTVLVFILLFAAVFAPTDAAFGDLPKALVYYLIQGDNAETLKALLTYHVVAGEFFSNDLSEGVPVLTLLGSTLDVSIMNGTVTINDATVTTADIDVSNGVIHVIDKVLVPDSITPPTLVDVGMADPMFETLVAAVTTAELVDALSGPGPLTLFAPTEAGFALLPAGTVEDLTTADDKTPLTEILLYHVVPELITAEAILNGRTSATTLRGANLTFSVMEMDGLEPHVVVNGVMVQGTAVAGNGIIHIISEVLTVPGDATIPAASPTIMAPTEDGALSTNSFVATLISGLSFAFAVLMN
jgi:transforming growth factor-beta-induced protein